MSNRDTGQDTKELSLEDMTRFLDNLDRLGELTGQNEELLVEMAEMRVALLWEQADEAEMKFIRLGIIKDIEEAIECRSQILLLTPNGHESKPSRYSALGSAFARRFQHVGDLSDLNKAIEHQTQAMLIIPDGHFNRPAVLSNLGSTYQLRFGRLGEPADLNKAIEYATQAVQVTPDGHPLKPTLHHNLGESFESRFGLVGEVADLNKAIEYKTQAVQLTPNGHPGMPGWLSQLGNSYESRFRRLGEVLDLDKAIEYQTQALQLTPDGHPHKPRWLDNLGSSYESRFRRFREVLDLEKAFEYQTQAVQLTPDGHPLKPRLLNNLGNSYQARFERLGKLADLNKAIEYQTQAVQLTPDRHPHNPSLLSNLGNSYWARFGRLGELTDLNKAIEYFTQAGQLTPDGHPDMPSLLNDLGKSYSSRFGRLGELVDVNKAIEYFTQAVQLTPDGHPDKPSRLNNLGIPYESRFGRLGELTDLNEAIKYQTQAMQLTPDGHPDKPSWLNNLGMSYESRFRRLGELADLNKAIEYQTKAVQLTPDGHPDMPSLLNNLGASYESRFRGLREPADLNMAIASKSQALVLIPDGHADKPKWFHNLGNSYLLRFSHLSNRSDLELAQSLFQSGAQLPLIHPPAQSRCARTWAKCSLLLASSPKSAYERCMELIPHLIWLGTTIDQRYTLLREINDLATEAAAWAISFETFDLALEWLEAGRSIVWNQILQLRTPFDDLALADPDLADELKATASALEAEGFRQSHSPPHNAPSNLEDIARQHHHLATKWEQLLAKARTTPGFQNFLYPRKAKALMLSARDGPVVILNAHRTRCDALILFPGCDDIAHLPLSGTSLEKLGQSHIQLQALLGHRRDRVGGIQRPRPVAKPEGTFKAILAACWSDVVQPVLDVIACKDEVQAEEIPHITWCTTGALSFLPLHAAGLYDGSRPNAPDLIISSYTPTLSALFHTGAPGTNPHSGLLAVGQEYTQGFSPLPSTVDELTAIKEHAKATKFQQLDSTSATVDAVLGAMESHSWVHLACHASQNPENPAQSAFHLHDGPLTLGTITKRSFKDKGLAFLSACQTATGDKSLADEAVHLAAGMLMAGYPSVIATMWSIQDEDGPKLADAVYAELLKYGTMDHRQAARALHKAVSGLRKMVGDEAFERWVPFIHIGV